MAPLPNLVADRLEHLASCLCAQIEADGGPPTCFCGVWPGETVALDYAGECEAQGVCGMAWVRLIQMYPSVSLGQPSAQPGNCAEALGLDVEVGLMRCASVMDDQGNPPSAGDLLADARQQMADAATMRRALLCCAPTNDLRLGSYVPFGPSGGVVGGTWTVSMMEL